MLHAVLYLAAAIIARFWHARIWWVYVAFAVEGLMPLILKLLQCGLLQ